MPLIEHITQSRIAPGARTPGKLSGDIRWHGSQNGQVALADRQLKVKRPRLRHKTGCEVKGPAYQACKKMAPRPGA